MTRILPILILTLLFAGCTSVPMGSPAKDIVLKEFKAPTNKTGIYIYRNEAFGSAIRMDILIDGLEVGSTAAKTYLYKEVEPGTHTVTSKSENRDSIEVEAKPGTLIFIWQEVKMGFMYAGTKLHLVSEKDGKAGVAESKLAVP